MARAATPIKMLRITPLRGCWYASIWVGALKLSGVGEPKGCRGSRLCCLGSCWGLFCHCGALMVAHTIPAAASHLIPCRRGLVNALYALAADRGRYTVLGVPTQQMPPLPTRASGCTQANTALSMGF